MQCPYCNYEMEKGIINQDRYPLKWKSEGPNAKNKAHKLYGKNICGSLFV